MTTNEALKNIKRAINSAPRNSYIAEFHVQVIKYAPILHDITAKEFCAALEISPAFGTEFSKMRKIANRLINAGLDVTKI